MKSGRSPTGAVMHVPKRPKTREGPGLSSFSREHSRRPELIRRSYMSVRCKFERSVLSHEEYEMVHVTHHPAIRGFDDEGTAPGEGPRATDARQGADAGPAEAALGPRRGRSAGRGLPRDGRTAIAAQAGVCSRKAGQ
jgi:hypothetical protein